MGPWMQSAGLTLLSFAVLITVLVFFHEMGHLLVGKFFGVKILRFSIGFGPRLFGFVRGETEYRFSLLPLGGYVKFAGDVPGEELPPEDRGRGFLEQRPGVKAAIAFAGPAANFVLAALIFFAINAVPHKEYAAVVGQVKPGSPAAQAGVLPGDRVEAVDGEPVVGFGAFQEKIRARPGKPLALSVVREGERLTLRITPAVHEEKNPLETVRHGRIGIALKPRLAEVTVVGPDAPAARAGLRTFDLVTRMDGQPVASWEDLAKKLAARGDAGVTLEVLRRRAVAAPGATLWAQEPLRIALPSARDAGLEAADLTVFGVQHGSAAQEAGLLRGDRIVSVDGREVIWWTDEVEAARRAAGATPMQFVVRRDGQLVTLTVRQQLRAARDEAGVRVQVPELGAEPDLAIFDGKAEIVTVRFGLGEAALRGIAGTGEAIRGMALGLAKIVTGKISSEAIGGPIMIADVARKAADEGWMSFLTVMAMISISLGLMNLIPIPVLDGFHMLSAGIEAVRRRPLSLRFREIANVVGVALVLSLMLFALKNDAVRKFFD